MSTYDLVASLPLEVDSYDLDGLQQDVSSGFTRRTTIVSLHGAGETGIGEDVTYEANEHELMQRRGPVHDLAGSHTIDSFSLLVGSLDLFPDGPPEGEAWRNYRRWAFESAGLDLALRQAGRSLADALGAEPQPVTFVVSLRLGEPPSPDRLLRVLTEYPGTRFKVDPTPDWDAPLVAQLADLGAVDTLDLKGAYRGTIVDNPGDPVLYRLVAEAFPQAWIEDPDLSSPETQGALAEHHDRITWDAVIHSVGDVESLPFPPKGLNIKPSRFGSIQALFDTYDYCRAQGMTMYGGGQFELGTGRSQIQHLASIFHPGSPNDVAPGGYNEPVPPSGLPPSPLPAAILEPGFR